MFFHFSHRSHCSCGQHPLAACENRSFMVFSRKKRCLASSIFIPPEKITWQWKCIWFQDVCILLKNGQIFHDIPCYFSGGVSCVCFFHLGARDPKIPSFGSDFWRNHAPKSCAAVDAAVFEKMRALKIRCAFIITGHVFCIFSVSISLLFASEFKMIVPFPSWFYSSSLKLTAKAYENRWLEDRHLFLLGPFSYFQVLLDVSSREGLDLM